MKVADQIAEVFLRWIDCVAGALIAVRRRLRTSRTVRLVEETDNTFVVLPPESGQEAGKVEHVRIVDGQVVGTLSETFQSRARANCIEVVLQPSRFLFRPLELPRRAGEFLDGIVRAQIDRLTPWSAEDAAFGWSRPSEIDSDKIVVTVAATTRSSVMPLVRTLAQSKADSLALLTVTPGGHGGAVPIKVFEQAHGAALQVQRLRRVLVGVLVVCGVAAMAAPAVDDFVGSSLQVRQDGIVHRIAVSRAAVRTDPDAGGNAALAGLERRKYQTPSSVIVLEALSRIFPDGTYVTELRIVGDKMQVVGITRDAPLLIRLLAQSAYFRQATFFAPTTHAPSQPGENFHIEARIVPNFAPPT